MDAGCAVKQEAVVPLLGDWPSWRPGFGPVRSGGRPSQAPGCLHPEARDPTVLSPWATILGDACASLTGVRVDFGRFGDGDPGTWVSGHGLRGIQPTCGEYPASLQHSTETTLELWKSQQLLCSPATNVLL